MTYKKKLEFIPSKNPIYTTYTLIEKKEDEIDLGFFLELAHKDKKVCNQTQVNTLIKDMEILKQRKFFLRIFSSS